MGRTMQGRARLGRAGRGVHARVRHARRARPPRPRRSGRDGQPSPGADLRSGLRRPPASAAAIACGRSPMSRPSASGSTRPITSRRAARTTAAAARLRDRRRRRHAAPGRPGRRDGGRRARTPPSASSCAITTWSASPPTAAANAVSRPRRGRRGARRASRRPARTSPTSAPTTSSSSTSRPASNGSSPPTAARRSSTARRRGSTWRRSSAAAATPSGGRRTAHASPSCASTTRRCRPSRSTTPTASTATLEVTRYPKAGDPNPYVRIGIVVDRRRQDDVDGLRREGRPLPRLPDMGDRQPDALRAVDEPRARTRCSVFACRRVHGQGRACSTRRSSASWVDWYDDLTPLSRRLAALLSDVDGWRHLYRYGADGTPVAAAHDRRLARAAAPRASPRPTAGSTSLGRPTKSWDTQVMRVKLAGGEPRDRHQGAWRPQGRVSPDGAYVIDTWSRR